MQGQAIDNASGHQTGFSFEVLPPLKGMGIERLFADIDMLREFDPQYVNITTHRSERVFRETAPGLFERVAVRKRPGTVAVAAAIKARYGLRVVPHILGDSTAIRQVMDTVRQVAPTRSSVLIQGESGTGKELVARALHELSGRKGDFVAIHCAAIPETLFESELFGHEKGAFTGAVEQHKGFFEKADGGTIFLDEIGEVPLPVQVKLLRVLETRSFERVGGTQNIAVDVRIVSATNRNLEEMVASGTFREDLYYRLNVVKILIPPLRERASDIPILVRGFLKQIAAENGKEDMTISEPAMAALRAARWPGNIRELRNCVENMVVLCRTGEIGLDNVPMNIRESSTPGITKDVLSAPSCDLEHNERILIERALNECGGNRSRAAEKLGISRRTLHRKLNLYNIE